MLKSPLEFNLLNQEPIIEKFHENQIINSMAEVTLQTEGQFKNFLAVSNIKVDISRRASNEEKGFYSSQLNLYQVHQGKVKTCLVDNYKRSISCLSSFMGKLVCTMVFRNWPELVLILWSFNEAKACLETPIPIPDGAVKNLASSISFD
jgi:hypothetical protein